MLPCRGVSSGHIGRLRNQHAIAGLGQAQGNRRRIARAAQEQNHWGRSSSPHCRYPRAVTIQWSIRRVLLLPMMTTVRMSTSCCEQWSRSVMHQRLVVLAGRGDDSHGRLARAGRPEDLDRLFQLPDPFLAAGVVQGHHEIGGGDRFQPAADDLPGNQQVAQADHGEVQHQRRPHGRGGGAGSRHAGNDLHGNVQVLGLGQFQGQPGHAVDAGVAGGDQGHDLARPRRCEGLAAALDFMRHAGSDNLLAGGQVGNRFQVGRIADDGLAFGNRLDCPQRAVSGGRRDLFQRHTAFPGDRHGHAVEYLLGKY